MYFYQIKCCFVIRIYSVTGRRYVMKKVDELTKNRREMDRVRENISVFVNHLAIVFWGPNEGDRKRTYISRLFSEYMLTFRVEEPMKICVTN